eukprot:tig00021234_g19418.t1
MQPDEQLLYAGGPSCTLHLRAEQPYRLRVAGIDARRHTPYARPAQVTLSRWDGAEAPGGRLLDAVELGVALCVGDKSPWGASNSPPPAPSRTARVAIGADGLAQVPFRLLVVSPAFDPATPLALRAVWADNGTPLPGPRGCASWWPPAAAGAPRAEAPSLASSSAGPAGPAPGPPGPKRPLSARELRAGAYASVAKRQRDLPPPPPRATCRRCARPRRAGMDAGAFAAAAVAAAAAAASEGSGSPSSTWSEPSLTPPRAPPPPAPTRPRAAARPRAGLGRRRLAAPGGAAGVSPPGPRPATAGEVVSPPRDPALLEAFQGLKARPPSPRPPARPAPSARVRPGRQIVEQVSVPALAAAAAEPLPPEPVRPLAFAVSDAGEAVFEMIERTVEELRRRAPPGAGPNPALQSIDSLAGVLELLRERPEDGPPAPQLCPASGGLFAIDALAEPDEPPLDAKAEAKQAWPARPLRPRDYGPEYLADVERRFAALAENARSATGAAEAEAALTKDGLLLSPLVRSYAGRLRLRAMLVALREASFAFAPVARVGRFLTQAARRRLRAEREPPLDSVLNAFEVVDALRPPMHNAVPDLQLISLDRAMKVLVAARDVARREYLRLASPASQPEVTMLYAEAVARIGEQQVADGFLEHGIEHLFEAWSLALRVGPAGSPSRLEARIILLLCEAHAFAPMAFHLAERVYWFCETVEDMHWECRACVDLALLSSAAGRIEEGGRWIERAFEIEGRLAPAEREREIVAYHGVNVRIFAALRAGSLAGVFSDSRRSLTTAISLPDRAHPCLDTFLGPFRSFLRPTPCEVWMDLFRFGAYLLTIFDPAGRAPNRLFALSGMAELYARMGRWRVAGVAFREALSAAGAFPKAFPLDHPRIRRLENAAQRCEELARSQPAAAA